MAALSASAHRAQAEGSAGPGQPRPLSRDWLRVRRSWDSCPDSLRAPRPRFLRSQRSRGLLPAAEARKESADSSRLQNHLLGRALGFAGHSLGVGRLAAEACFRVRAQNLVRDCSSPWKNRVLHGLPNSGVKSPAVVPRSTSLATGTFLLRLGSFR